MSTIDIKNLSNRALVKQCAKDPDNRNLWSEFYSRFDERIWLVVYRECKEKGIVDKSSQFKQIIQDLVQDVYVKLVEKKCKALTEFIGVSENSIYTYLGIIAKNVVRNFIMKTNAQKRASIEKSLDEKLTAAEEGGDLYVKDTIKSTNDEIDDELSMEYIKEEIENILNTILKGRDRERNKLIFKLYFYEGFKAEEIVSQFNFDLSLKSVQNLISGIKKELRIKLYYLKAEYL